VKSESDLEQASARLMAALDALDAQTKAVLRRMENTRNAEEVDEDRARLAADLDAAQARADQLEVAAKDAGSALDAAIADVRNALGSI
jgi:seryl-tRNA synthetase